MAGRPRTFDQGVVLDRAIDLFSRQGFEATTLQQLEREMRLGRGSLYAAFGDKLGLFRAALERYDARQTASAVRALDDEPSGLIAVRRFLDGVVNETMAFAGQRDCLVTVAAVEMAVRDEGTTDRVRASFHVTEAALTRAIARARSAGEIPAGPDPALLASFLLNTVHGIKVRARVTADRTLLTGLADTALEALT